MINASDIATLTGLIRGESRILVFTGAGVSTASGIPDFRGPQGVWKRRQPIYYQNFLASHEARVEYWDQKVEAYDAFREAEPNAVHEMCVRLEQAGKVIAVVTQNVDGLHFRAGTSRGCLVELHGTNDEIECLGCGNRYEPDLYFRAFADTHVPPRCGCGGLVKTATISFGQNLREEDLSRAFAAAQDANLVISLGSTLSVHPAASVPLTAAERGVPYAIVNQGETDQDGHPSVTVRLDGDVTEIFPRAVAEAMGW
ncbi:TPA: NAD-dependent deacetylase [Candidatus Latescibacteria bacterium]|nr:NAD-dependent deacetylase [Candidatus Latescibacterota bacterium]